MIRIKRAHEARSRIDGDRVLIDRLWPRGLTKTTAHLDGWHKELAPSNDLRKWFAHDPARFPEFRTRYKKELSNPTARALLRTLAQRALSKTVTLVYGAHDEAHNNAVVLAAILKQRLSRISAPAQSSSSSRPRAARKILR